MSLKSVLYNNCRALTSLANSRLAMIISYSTWLFNVLNAKCKDFSTSTWLGPSITIPTPPPFEFQDPLTYNVHQSFSGMHVSYK